MAPPGYDYGVLARLDCIRTSAPRARQRRCWRRCRRTPKARSWPGWPSSAPATDGAPLLELAAQLAGAFRRAAALGILDYSDSRVTQARTFQAAFLQTRRAAPK
jgi:hypothetical protein